MTDDTQHIELRKMIEMASKWLENWYKTHQESGAIWHVVTAYGQQMILPQPPIPDKDLAAELIRRAFAKMKVIRCIFMDESWMAECDPADKQRLQRIQQVGASNMPDRIEVVSFMGEDQWGNLNACRIITRDAAGNASLGPLEFADPDKSIGRFTHMIANQHGTRH